MEALREHCGEFLATLASHANRIAESENKKEIQPHHMLSALSSMGFSAYADQLTHVDPSSLKKAKVGEYVCLLFRFNSILCLFFQETQEEERLRRGGGGAGEITRHSPS